MPRFPTPVKTAPVKSFVVKKSLLYGFNAVNFLSSIIPPKNLNILKSNARVPELTAIGNGYGGVGKRFTEKNLSGTNCPLTATEYGLELLQEHRNNLLDQTMPASDGYTQNIVPLSDFIDQKRYVQKGSLTPRMISQLIAAVPITQQQAALNFALLIHHLSNTDSKFAEMANTIACLVGEEWGSLPSTVPSFGTNSGNASTGLIHLYGDVPRVIMNILLAERDSKKITDLAYTIGGACKLAGASAEGAVVGTQGFLRSVENSLRLPNIPILARIKPLVNRYPSLNGSLQFVPARAFFTEEMVKWAVEGRDEIIIKNITGRFPSQKGKEVVEAFKAGQRDNACEKEAVIVKKVAQESSTKLAGVTVNPLEH